MSDDENEHSPDNLKDVEVVQKVVSTKHNGSPVIDEQSVPCQMLESMPTTIPTIPVQVNMIMQQINKVKQDKTNTSKNVSLIPGFRLCIKGRNFYLLPEKTCVWNEFRTAAAQKKGSSRKEANIRSEYVLKAYLEYIYDKEES